MNKFVHRFINDILHHAPTAQKEDVIKYALSNYDLVQDRKVYYCRYFAVRFCYSRNGSFSNTVLSLSALQKYDNIPMLVVLTGKGKNSVFLANSTFISKISHSSKELSTTRIRGSFNGSDILKEYAGRRNEPANFDELFAIHQGLDWEDNLNRIVEATSAICPKSERFMPDDVQMQNLYDSVARAQRFVLSDNFKNLRSDLNERCRKCREAIFAASHIENVNLRGRLIEYLITTDDDDRERIKHLLKEDSSMLPEFKTRDDLGDYVRRFENDQTYTDIKTKVIYLNSAPKAYNIDKFLAKMSDADSSFFFFIIGLDESGVFNTVLCSVYHDELIDASVVQHHWAGRATRGVVQFAGSALNKMLERPDFANNIEAEKAAGFLDMLLAR